LDCRDVFALVAFDSLDYEFAVRQPFGFALLGGFGFCSFLLGVFLGTLSLRDGEGREP